MARLALRNLAYKRHTRGAQPRSFRKPCCHGCWIYNKSAGNTARPDPQSWGKRRSLQGQRAGGQRVRRYSPTLSSSETLSFRREGEGGRLLLVGEASLSLSLFWTASRINANSSFMDRITCLELAAAIDFVTFKCSLRSLTLAGFMLRMLSTSSTRPSKRRRSEPSRPKSSKTAVDISANVTTSAPAAEMILATSGCTSNF
mmetsp:Transcript_106089/g.306891  ORF Transcript_106089/g.306891 Transcript_106089/m.306891 type:complete len:201 (-) Transcript_106089:2319-2921(-)